ncbi:MAG: acetyltransferase [Aeromicrobium sp.]|nr:acetyltransferase [Aeromicrobium sp.]
MTETKVADYTIRALDDSTWPAFRALAEKHNGVWGGCWCTWFHPTCVENAKGQPAAAYRDHKQNLVHEGKAHAALVFDGDVAVGWCEYGTPEELPNIHHRKEYEATAETLPDYRLTCFFIDRDYRRQGVARAALDGALDLIGKAGGGVVEGYPHDLPPGKKVSSSFLYNVTRTTYEKAGFVYDRPKGQGNCVMRKTVAPR